VSFFPPPSQNSVFSSYSIQSSEVGGPCSKEIIIPPCGTAVFLPENDSAAAVDDFASASRFCPLCEQGAHNDWRLIALEFSLAIKLTAIVKDLALPFGGAADALSVPFYLRGGDQGDVIDRSGGDNKRKEEEEEENEKDEEEEEDEEKEEDASADVDRGRAGIVHKLQPAFYQRMVIRPLRSWFDEIDEEFKDNNRYHEQEYAIGRTGYNRLFGVMTHPKRGFGGATAYIRLEDADTDQRTLNLAYGVNARGSAIGVSATQAY